MKLDNPVFLVVAGLAAALVVAVALNHFFSRDARIQRRKRKSNARVINKAHRPTVRFSVKTDEREQ